MELSQKEIRKNIWTLAWPAILRMVFQTSVGVVTLILVGNYISGADSVAAIGLAQRVMFLDIGILMSLGVGTTALIAHYYGAGNEKEAEIVLSQSLMIGVAVATVLGFLLDKFGPLAIRVLLLGNPDEAIVSMGSSYLQVVGYSMIFGVLMMVINSALQGAGDMKTPMFFTITMNVLTIVLGIFFIPKWGLTGAGLAEGLSRAAAGFMAFIFLLSQKLTVKIVPVNLFRPRPKVIKRVLNIGLPAAGEQFVNQSSQIIYTILIAGLGTVAIAANQVVMTVQSISFMPGFGFGVAATTLVGQNLGAKKPKDAEAYGYETNKFAAIFMGVMAIVFFLWPYSLAQIFVPDEDVVALAASCLRIVAFAQIPVSIVMVLSGGLRGAGDTRWVMYITTIGQWGVRLVLALIMIKLGFGLQGVWIAMLTDMVIRSILILIRYRSGRWKYIMSTDSQHKLNTKLEH